MLERSEARSIRIGVDADGGMSMGWLSTPVACVLVPHKGGDQDASVAACGGGGSVPKTWVVVCHRWRLHGVKPCRYLPRGVQSFFVRRGHLVFTLTSQPWKGISVTACFRVKGVFTSLDKPFMEWEFPQMKKKQVQADGGGGRHLVAMESNILTDLVPLVEHMAVTRYDDGDNRLTGWVTIKTQGAAWVVQVKDPDSGNSFQVVDSSIDKALETASLMLACDQAPWSPDPFLKRPGAKKKN